ncbi:ATP-dependent Lon protease [Desulfosalsimonas propionicica]|uniref:Lon protease n=1 Tax=Desulfosalsimonas propionicica TaxID=332175 RepID=A0A7W0C7L0_9BACT|nr:endopeptidase La [Desulfosalsimonas propionicica]MBA2880602.1 ATP-dependent Lon protease [Desulfosalsimonas propionicica]
MAESDKDDLIRLIDESDEREVEIPDRLPLLPVRDMVIFTDMVLPLYIGREKSLRAVEAAMKKERLLFLAAQKDPMAEDPKSKDIYRVGTVCRILRMIKLPDGHFKVLIHGLEKGRVKRFASKKQFYEVSFDLLPDDSADISDVEHQALMRNVRENCEKILNIRGEYTGEISMLLDEIENPGKLADLVSSNLKLKTEEAQGLLETEDPVERLKQVNNYLAKEVELSTVQAKIQSHVRDEISKNQRDYFLREQVRAIHKELGEQDERSAEVEEYRKRIKKAKMPKEAAKEAEKQLKRLEQMHPDSSEATIVRTYLDWLVDLPWSRSTKDVIDIPKAKSVLDKNHYGLDRVKDRILEYLSVRKLNPNKKGQILCFVGPPGVGKTSLGQSIADAMNRNFFRMSLGGIRDEAEIRGHRRTYIGAMPGRILQGLKHCNSNNPVFMMDEIDKIGMDFRGDPSSALLEALDPEQNTNFSDHFVNMPFDLSRVLFILTANMTDTIPSALLDRMEVIQLAGYTEEEKQVIARRYLLPRQLSDNGLKSKDLSVSNSALARLITEYTSEAGLRNLERELGALCRKVARKMAEGKKGPFRITRGSLNTYLGPPRYIPELDQDETQVGLATGLAWTQVGGEVLYVEVSLLEGKGELIITGQLGEVMQESARAAVSYARAHQKELGLEKNVFESIDIHIHVPAGAIPKDGPSAGIAMATALISALTGQPVDKCVAMTGEISLRGRVLPIGGLREKAIGALRFGINTIIIPEKNKPELSEIPKNVRRKIQFIPVSTLDQAIEVAIGKDLAKKSAAAAKKKKTPARSTKKPAKKPANAAG